MTHRRSGFSMVELMVTLAVLSILLVFAYPSMRDFIRRNRNAAQSNSLMADLQYARGQAAATRSYVSICPRANTTDATCATTGSYDLGWVVYNASAANVAYASTAAGASASLQRLGPSVSANTSIRASASGPLTYNSRGELLQSGGSTNDVTFSTCAKASAGDSAGTSTSRVPGVQLNVSHSGRVSSRPLAAGDACS